MSVSIVLPAAASKLEENAAAELSLWLPRAYSDAFAVVHEPYMGVGIYVGFTAFAAAQDVAAAKGWNDRANTESWVIAEKDGSLILTGGQKNDDRGILYAVEHYLEEVVGIRFWNAMEEYVPANGAFSVPAGLSLSGIPKADMRFPISCSWIGDDMRFCIRRRTNQTEIPSEWGGGVTCSRRGGC